MTEGDETSPWDVGLWQIEGGHRELVGDLCSLLMAASSARCVQYVCVVYARVCMYLLGCGNSVPFLQDTAQVVSGPSAAAP